MQTLSHSQAHTQGPWSCVPGKFFIVYSYVDDEPIAVPKTEANAQLIAAAPELYEAAKLVLAWYDAEEDHSQEPDFYKRVEMCRASESAIRAAIAKAEGGAA